MLDMSITLPKTPAHGFAESVGAGEDQDPSQTTTLERLLNYLLAAKRSLSATHHVWRANEIVNSARDALTDGVIIQARSGFLKQAIVEQLKVLKSVNHGVEQVARHGQEDFETTLRDLDDADARLQATVDLLKSTLVEPSLRPLDEDRKTLHYFVDEHGVEKLKADIRGFIDQTQEAHHELLALITEFNNDIASIRRTMESQPGLYTDPDGYRAPLATILPSLENQAKEMAELLESLVRHFDLCVTALKHTEGGGAAVQNVTTDLPVEIRVDPDDAGKPIEPISDQERQEMLDVLAKDAAELEDVVMEIRDRLTEMETQFDYLNAYLEHLATINADTLGAFQQLEEVGTRLPRYVLHGREFMRRWEEQKQQIIDRMEELENLREFYDNFLAAYDGLIIEIGRRRNVQNKMEAIAQEAMSKIDQLYQGMTPGHS